MHVFLGTHPVWINVVAMIMCVGFLIAFGSTLGVMWVREKRAVKVASHVGRDVAE